MRTEDAINLFGETPAAGILNLAAALNITRAAIYQWGDTVPPLRVYQIRELLEKQSRETTREAA
jgi:hypothetical protein